MVRKILLAVAGLLLLGAFVMWRWSTVLTNTDSTKSTYMLALMVLLFFSGVFLIAAVCLRVPASRPRLGHDYRPRRSRRWTEGL